jgi:hypothetical protein
VTELLSLIEFLQNLEELEEGLREKTRSYIGASTVGNECTQYLNLCLRGFPEDKPSPKLQRIFNVGHALETIVIDDLRKRQSAKVLSTDELTGEQYEYTALGGHLICHLDGIIYFSDDDPYVLEIKTMNKSKFNAFVKKGVKISHPQYLAQVMLSMHLSNIPQGLLLAICKDDCRYHIECLVHDDFEVANLRQRISNAISRPERISHSPDDWRCKGCFKRTACWNPEEITPKPQCRLCKYAQPDLYGENKQWHCGKHDAPAKKACEDYEMLTTSRPSATTTTGRSPAPGF